MAPHSSCLKRYPQRNARQNFEVTDKIFAGGFTPEKQPCKCKLKRSWNIFCCLCGIFGPIDTTWCSWKKTWDAKHLPHKRQMQRMEATVANEKVHTPPPTQELSKDFVHVLPWDSRILCEVDLAPHVQQDFRAKCSVFRVLWICLASGSGSSQGRPRGFWSPSIRGGVKQTKVLVEAKSGGTSRTLERINDVMAFSLCTNWKTTFQKQYCWVVSMMFRGNPQKFQTTAVWTQTK